MICRGSGVGVKALRPRSGARMRGLDSDPTSATLRESGECRSLRFIADHSARRQPFGHFRKNQQPSEQPPTKIGLSFPRGQFRSKLFVLLVPGGGVEPPRSQGSADFESAASASSAIPASGSNYLRKSNLPGDEYWGPGFLQLAG